MMSVFMSFFERIVHETETLEGVKEVQWMSVQCERRERWMCEDPRA